MAHRPARRAQLFPFREAGEDLPVVWELTGAELRKLSSMHARGLLDKSTRDRLLALCKLPEGVRQSQLKQALLETAIVVDCGDYDPLYLRADPFEADKVESFWHMTPIERRRIAATRRAKTTMPPIETLEGEVCPTALPQRNIRRRELYIQYGTVMACGGGDYFSLPEDL